MAATSSKPFSISFGSSKPKQAQAPLLSKKRPHSALADPDSDHDEEHSGPQKVTGFDQSAGGAISTSTESRKGPLVIQAQKNRDWREESRRKRRKNLLPAEVQAARNNTNGVHTNGTTERDEVSLEAGLKFASKDADGDVSMEQRGQPKPDPSPEVKQTADDEAIEALLGKKKASTLVIPADRNEYNNDGNDSEDQAEDYRNDDERYRADVAARPDVASLEDYDRIPVEDFGSAMLRGMGWKEGQVIGKNGEKAKPQKKVERRANLLGIGAKETPGGVGDEFGAWGKSIKGKRKTDIVYNPIMLRNEATGEMVTEEEMEKRKLESKKSSQNDGKGDRRSKTDAINGHTTKERLKWSDGRNGDYNKGERSRSNERRAHHSRENGDYSSSRRRQRSRSSDDRRHRSSRKDRSRSRERRHHRRDHDDYDDRKRHRDRESYRQ